MKLSKKDLLQYFKFLNDNNINKVGNTDISIKLDTTIDSNFNLCKMYFIQLNTLTNFHNIRINNDFSNFETNVNLTNDVYENYLYFKNHNDLRSELSCVKISTSIKRKVKL